MSGSEVLQTVKPSCTSTKILGNKGRNVEVVRNKVLCLPEIMEKILAFLDMRSLKQVRLVSKGWTLKAQVHMERRGIVRLVTPGRIREDRFQSFLDTCNSKLSAIPMPFQALDVVVHTTEDEIILNSVFTELLSLPSPLLITRLNTGDIPPKTTLPLIVRVSSSLEYLHLEASYSWKDSHPLKPKPQEFSKLRHIYVEALDSIEDNGMATFPSLVSWLVSSSPSLETYELSVWCDDLREFASALVMKVDIKDVKALRLRCHSDLNSAAQSHLISIPFWRLEALDLNIPEDSGATEALTAVVTKSCMTLKELDLSWLDLGEEEQARFPVCPNIHELRLTWFPCSNDFLPRHFPSLQSVTLWENYWMALDGTSVSTPPFFGVKTLRLNDCSTTMSDQSVNILFQNFPSIENLSIDGSSLLFGLTLVSRGLPNSPNLLEGVKHLVLDGGYSWSHMDYAGWYCLLSVLTGLESIEVNTTEPEIITTLPVKELLPRLNVIKFPWNDRFHVPKLLEMTGQVKKVLISNCCSVQRGDNFWSGNRLEEFFESAPNAECGCGTSSWKSRLFPEGRFVSASEGL